MDLVSFRCRTASVLCDRLSVLAGTAVTPTELAQYLHRRCGIGLADCERLAWGDDLALTAQASDRIAGEFGLHPRLLRCALTAMSAEVLGEELLLATEQLPVHECLTCATLAADAVEAVERPGHDEQRDQLLIDVIEHHANEHAAAAPVSDAAQQIREAVSGLPAEAQQRVLAYALHELARQ